MQTRYVGYISSMLVNMVLLFAAHNVLDWGIGFITAGWSDVMWAVELSLVVSIIANAALLVYDGRVFRRLTELVTTATALGAAYQLYVVYPFDFGEWDALVRFGSMWVVIAILIALVVVAILAVVDVLTTLVRAVTGGEVQGHEQ